MFLHLLVLAILGKIAQGTVVGECLEGVLPYRVDLKGCDVNPPCQITNNIEFEMEFRAPQYLGNISPKLTLTVDGIDLSPILEQKDACDGISIALCPIITNDAAIYNFNVTLNENALPEKSVSLLAFSIIDNDVDKAAVCFQLECQN